MTATTEPYVIIAVQSYNLDKNTLYGTRVPDGKRLLIKSELVSPANFIHTLGNPQLNSYAPKGALVALFDVKIINQQSG